MRPSAFLLFLSPSFIVVNISKGTRLKINLIDSELSARLDCNFVRMVSVAEELQTIQSTIDQVSTID
jgi:hypothetical protein